MYVQIYISNLSPTITAEKLFQFFGEATESKVLHVRMHTDATPISKLLCGVASMKLVGMNVCFCCSLRIQALTMLTSFYTRSWHKPRIHICLRPVRKARRS
jgi:hypothetical protein